MGLGPLFLKHTLPTDEIKRRRKLVIAFSKRRAGSEVERLSDDSEPNPRTRPQKVRRLKEFIVQFSSRNHLETMKSKELSGRKRKPGKEHEIAQS